MGEIIHFNPSIETSDLQVELRKNQSPSSVCYAISKIKKNDFEIKMESLFNASYIIITLLVDWTFKKQNPSKWVYYTTMALGEFLNVGFDI